MLSFMTQVIADIFEKLTFICEHPLTYVLTFGAVFLVLFHHNYSQSPFVIYNTAARISCICVVVPVTSTSILGTLFPLPLHIMNHKHNLFTNKIHLYPALLCLLIIRNPSLYGESCKWNGSSIL